MPVYCEIGSTQKTMKKLYVVIGNTTTYCPCRKVTINGSEYFVHRDKTEISTLYTASTTWKAPNNVTQILLEIVGGGGSGASYTQYRIFMTGGCGGAGGYFKGYINVTPGTTYTLTVGAGGAGKEISGENGFNGNDGTASKFGSIITCNGGKHGTGRYSGYAQVEHSYSNDDGDYSYYSNDPVQTETAYKGGAGGTVTIGNSGAVAKTLYKITGAAGADGEYIYKRNPQNHGGDSGWKTYTSSAKPYYGRGGDGGRTSYNNSTTATFSTGERMAWGHSESGQQGAIKITYYKWGGKYV